MTNRGTSDATAPMSEKETIDTEAQRGLFRWIWRSYMRRHWPTIAVAGVLMSIEGSMLGALSYMMKPMFDQVFIEGDTGAHTESAA